MTVPEIPGGGGAVCTGHDSRVAPAPTLTPGIYELDAPAYHADPCETPSLSASIAKVLIAQSPAHAKAAHPRLNPDLKRDDDPRFDVGNVSHSLFLQGLATAEVLPFADWRTAAAKEARVDARARGLVPLLQEQATEVYAMVNALTEQLAALNIQPALFTEGKPEQTLVWEEAGVMCRARLDWLRSDFTACDDLKSTSRSARAEAWARGPLYDQGADIQAAMYLRAIKALTGVAAKWRWVVVETKPPYALSVITPGADVLALADAKVDKALAIWKACLKHDRWPAYPAEVFRAELPPWHEARWLEQEAREDEAA